MNSVWSVVSPGLQVFEITGYSANFDSTLASSLLNKYLLSDAVFKQTIFKEQQQRRMVIAVIEQRF